jgi:hypothetical protein
LTSMLCRGGATGGMGSGSDGAAAAAVGAGGTRSGRGGSCVAAAAGRSGTLGGPPGGRLGGGGRGWDGIGTVALTLLATKPVSKSGCRGGGVGGTASALAAAGAATPPGTGGGRLGQAGELSRGWGLLAFAPSDVADVEGLSECFPGMEGAATGAGAAAAGAGAGVFFRRAVFSMLGSITGPGGGREPAGEMARPAGDLQELNNLTGE